MIKVLPVTLEFNGLRLEPLAPHHEDGLRAAGALARLLDRHGRGEEAEQVWTQFGPEA